VFAAKWLGVPGQATFPCQEEQIKPQTFQGHGNDLIKMNTERACSYPQPILELNNCYLCHLYYHGIPSYKIMTQSNVYRQCGSELGEQDTGPSSTLLFTRLWWSAALCLGLPQMLKSTSGECGSVVGHLPSTTHTKDLYVKIFSPKVLELGTRTFGRWWGHRWD
jgi:hypothetical protein